MNSVELYLRLSASVNESADEPVVVRCPSPDIFGVKEPIESFGPRALRAPLAATGLFAVRVYAFQFLCLAPLLLR